MVVRNAMPFPSPASANTTPTGIFCSMAFRSCFAAISGLV
jgi:hypothetical protein